MEGSLLQVFPNLQQYYLEYKQIYSKHFLIMHADERSLTIVANVFMSATWATL